jgi:hypothetical protein
MKVRQLRKLFHDNKEEDSIHCQNDGEISHALNVAIADAQRHDPNGMILVCGTAFIMSEVRAQLGINEPRDSIIFGGGTNSSSTPPRRDAQVCVIMSFPFDYHHSSQYFLRNCLKEIGYEKIHSFLSFEILECFYWDLLLINCLFNLDSLFG